MKTATAARRAQKESMRARAGTRGPSVEPAHVPARPTRAKRVPWRQRDGGRQPHDDEGQARRLVGILPKNVDEDRHRQDAASRAERADDDADECADEERFNDHWSFRVDVV